jgi:hypothetical protein
MEELGEKFSDIGNRTRDLPARATVPQGTTKPRSLHSARCFALSLNPQVSAVENLDLHESCSI